MGSIVLFAAVLLVASANPIANYNSHSSEDAADSHTEDLSHLDQNSEFSTGADTAHDSAKEPTSSDNFTGFAGKPVNTHSGNSDGENWNSENTDSENAESGNTDSGNANGGDGNGGNANSGDADSGSTLTSSVNTVSTTPTTVLNEENATNSSKDEATSINEAASEDPTTPNPVSSEIELHKSDDSDCRFTNSSNHTYVKCQFVCEMDEVELAPANSSCYLNQTTTTFGSLGGRSTLDSMETGICQDGDCVPRRTEAPTSISTTEPSTSASTTETTRASTTITSTSASETAATSNSRGTSSPDLVSMA